MSMFFGKSYGSGECGLTSCDVTSTDHACEVGYVLNKVVRLQASDGLFPYETKNVSRDDLFACYKCQVEEWCPNGIGCNSSSNRTGKTCHKCKAGDFQLLGKCRRCPKPYWSAILVAILATALYILYKYISFCF